LILRGQKACPYSPFSGSDNSPLFCAFPRIKLTSAENISEVMDRIPPLALRFIFVTTRATMSRISLTCLWFGCCPSRCDPPCVLPEISPWNALFPPGELVLPPQTELGTLQLGLVPSNFNDAPSGAEAPPHFFPSVVVESLFRM